MSLLDKASLIVTPNAYKESKLYSVVPNTTLGDMDVVRATTATRVNSAGLIEVVPRNLLTYSEQFDDASWTKTNSTVTANSAVSPSGTLTADKIIASAVPGDKYIFKLLTINLAQPFTISAFFKKSEYRLAFLRGGGQTSQPYVMYNLDTQSIVSTSGTSSTKIENYGNGWYRISLTLNSSTTTVLAPNFYFAPDSGYTLDASNVLQYTGNGTSGGFLWGAQVEQGLTATEYFPTTTRLNIPRIDYTNGSCPSLLVEPQRTNVLTYSEQFDNAAWVKSSVGSGLNPVVTANFGTSPSGNNDADRIVFSTTLSTDISQIVQTIPLTVSSTGSVYLKAFASGDVGKIIAIRFNSAGYTLVTLTNSWQRFSVTATALGSFDIALRPALGTSTGSVSVLAWGSQLEAGSYPTSYIPTVASSVTRNADVISKTGITDLIGQTEGTLFCDVNLNSRVSFTYFAIANNLASATDYLGIAFLNNSIAFESVVAGAVQANISHSNTSTGRFKIAAAYKANDFILYINGTQIGVDTSGTIPTCSQLGLSAFNQAQALNYNSAQLYKTKLSNTELQSLTTL